jgi:hypothetical protein
MSTLRLLPSQDIAWPKQLTKLSNSNLLEHTPFAI